MQLLKTVFEAPRCFEGRDRVWMEAEKRRGEGGQSPPSAASTKHESQDQPSHREAFEFYVPSSLWPSLGVCAKCHSPASALHTWRSPEHLPGKPCVLQSILGRFLCRTFHTG